MTAVLEMPAASENQCIPPDLRRAHWPIRLRPDFSGPLAPMAMASRTELVAVAALMKMTCQYALDTDYATVDGTTRVVATWRALRLREQLDPKLEAAYYRAKSLFRVTAQITNQRVFDLLCLWERGMLTYVDERRSEFRSGLVLGW